MLQLIVPHIARKMNNKSTGYLSIRMPPEELEILTKYCEQASRSKTDIIREYVRTLKRKLKHG
jgi:predicted DNA-binding protein